MKTDGVKYKDGVVIINPKSNFIERLFRLKKKPIVYVWNGYEYVINSSITFSK